MIKKYIISVPVIVEIDGEETLEVTKSIEQTLMSSFKINMISFFDKYSIKNDSSIPIKIIENK